MFPPLAPSSPPMLNLLCILLAAARSSLRSRRELALENLALRQGLAILGRRAKRPTLSTMDRAFWVALTRLWPAWRRPLMLVKPATVIGWHRKGFALYWPRKSRRRAGRPRVDAEVRALIRQMAADNVGWGAPRIRHVPIALRVRGARAPPTARPARQRHRRTHGAVDGAAGHQRVPVRHGPARSPSGPGHHLRPPLRRTRQRHGHRGRAQRSLLAMAQLLRRTRHRQHPARMHRPPNCPRR